MCTCVYLYCEAKGRKVKQALSRHSKSVGCRGEDAAMKWRSAREKVPDR